MYVHTSYMHVDHRSGRWIVHAHALLSPLCVCVSVRACQAARVFTLDPLNDGEVQYVLSVWVVENMVTSDVFSHTNVGYSSPYLPPSTLSLSLSLFLSFSLSNYISVQWTIVILLPYNG